MAKLPHFARRVSAVSADAIVAGEFTAGGILKRGDFMYGPFSNQQTHAAGRCGTAMRAAFMHDGSRQRG